MATSVFSARVFLVSALFLAVPAVAHSAAIVGGDVTAVLGAPFMFDDAATGGNDNDATTFTRDFNGVSAGKWSAGQQLTLRGLGWASSAAGTVATMATVTFTDLGPDGQLGGGDDVMIGTVTDNLTFFGASEYVWAFDAPVVGVMTGPVLRIQITGNGVIRRKTTSGNTQANVKLSLAGEAATGPPPPAGVWVAGYEIGSGVLAWEGAGMFIEHAAAGGGDAIHADGVATWVAELANLWNPGAAVTLSGLAIPIHAGTGSSTENGLITVTFYDLGANQSFDGAAAEVVLATRTASFDGQGTTGTGVYSLQFDPPLWFTAVGSGLAIHVANSGSLRLKTNAAPGALRKALTNGGAVPGDSHQRISLAGSAVGGTPPGVTFTSGDAGFWDSVTWSDGGTSTIGSLPATARARIGGYRAVTYRGIPADQEVTAIELGESSSVQGQGRLIVQSGNLSTSGNLVVGRSAAANDGFVEVRGGSLRIGGDADFGRVTDGADGSLIVAGGQVEVAGALRLGAFEQSGAMLRFHNPGSSPVVQVQSLVLGRCALDLTYDSAYLHVPGTVMTLVEYAMRDGQFGNFRNGDEFHCGRHRFRIDYDVPMDSGRLAIRLTALADWVTARKPPNVIFIFTDDQGYADTQLNGHPTWAQRYPMPRLQAMAGQGARLTDAYVTGGVCHPSRVGLITGRNQQRFGTDNNLSGPRHNGMAVSQSTVPARLQALGYKTYGIGKWHLGSTVEYHPNVRGFDRWYGMWSGSRSYYNASAEDTVFQDQMTPVFGDENGGYLTDRIGDKGVAFIDEHLATAPDQPFFMFMSYTAVHGPNDMVFLDERFSRLQNQYGLTQADYAETPTVYNSDKAKTELERYRLAGMTLALDDNIGKVIDKLAAENLTEDTIIVYMTDNGGPGWATGSGGNWSYNFPLRGLKGGGMTDGSIRVPCAVAWPGTIPGGQVIGTPVSSMDMMATFVNGGGAPAAARNGLDGLDLLPLLRDGTPLPAERALSWRASGVAGGGSAIRIGDWKMLITDTSQSAALYNIATNPGENNNLAAAEPAILARLKSRYDAWESGTIAPLYGTASTLLDAGLERHGISGGYRLMRSQASLAWLSSIFRQPVPTGEDFHFRFLARATEASTAPAAALAYALGDSDSRAGFVRAVIDYGQSKLRLEDGKSGASAAMPVAAGALAAQPGGFGEAALDYRAATRTLTFSFAGASVELVLSPAHGQLSHFAVGAAAMEAEITALVRTDGRGLGETSVIRLQRQGAIVELMLSSPNGAPFEPGLFRSAGLSGFARDEEALIENLGGGLYRATVAADQEINAEFFRFQFDQPESLK